MITTFIKGLTCHMCHPDQNKFKRTYIKFNSQWRRAQLRNNSTYAGRVRTTNK